MTGERLLWHQIADRLKMSVKRCKREMSSREFLDWATYLRIDSHRRDPSHYYLAQIALEVRRVLGRKKYRLEDFLLDPQKPTKPQTPEPQTEQEAQQRAEQSKNAWLSLAGIKKV